MNVARDVVTKTSCFANVSVDTLMNNEVLTAYEGWSISYLNNLFINQQLTCAAVVAADGELIGEATLADLLRFQERLFNSREAEALNARNAAANQLSPRDIKAHKLHLSEYRTVNEVMRPKVFAVDISADLNEACELILEHELNHVYVTQHGRLEGIVKVTDFLRLSIK